MLKVCLIIAIVAGLAVGVLNFVQIKDKITGLKDDLKTQTEGRQKAETDLAKTKKDLDKTNATLKETQSTLATTTEERDTAVKEAATQGKRADKLNDDLNKTRTERDAAQSELAAYKISGLTPEQVVNASKEMTRLNSEIAEQNVVSKAQAQKIVRLTRELDWIKGPNHPIKLPPQLAGKVMVTDPKWNFVVLNVGEDQGVLEHGELLVSRNGKLVAKVIVSNVQKDRSIANVMPGWQLGEVFEGDQVVPAYPGES